MAERLQLFGRVELRGGGWDVRKLGLNELLCSALYFSVREDQLLVGGLVASCQFFHGFSHMQSLFIEKDLLFTGKEA